MKKTIKRPIIAVILLLNVICLSLTGSAFAGTVTEDTPLGGSLVYRYIVSDYHIRHSLIYGKPYHGIAEITYTDYVDAGMQTAGGYYEDASWIFENNQNDDYSLSLSDHANDYHEK